MIHAPLAWGTGIVLLAGMTGLGACQRINPDFDGEGAVTGGASGAGSDTWDDDGATTGAGGGDTDTAAGEDCDEPLYIEVLVEEAEVVPPMQRRSSQYGEGEFAFSEVADGGAVRFEVDVPCNDTFWLWGRVLDLQDGTRFEGDPDSFYVSVDGSPEVTWFYGCQTRETSGVWSWARADDNEYGEQCDEAQPVSSWCEAGVHAIELRNREPINGDGQHAGIARIIVTNDPDYEPPGTRR